ncbi:MAG: hypothetical protein ACI4Q3_04730 [Kiritimatiellia bacterium]
MYRLFFLVFPFVAWPILFWVGVRPLRLPAGRKLVLALALLAASQKFVVYAVLGGDPFMPELPSAFIHATGWAYSAFDGFRIVQLSDLHCSAAARRGS